MTGGDDGAVIVRCSGEEVVVAELHSCGTGVSSVKRKESGSVRKRR
jgi:hypothetical protein